VIHIRGEDLRSRYSWITIEIGFENNSWPKSCGSKGWSTDFDTDFVGDVVIPV